jgi:DNA gyrase inhibitor GyrI
MRLMEGSYGKKHLLPRERISGKAVLKMTVPAKDLPDQQEILDLEVVDMPACRVAYVSTRVTPGVPNSDEHWTRLFEWAAPKWLFESLLIAAIWNDPDSNDQMTYDACLSVPESFAVDKTGDVRLKTLPGGEYGIYHGRLPSTSEFIPTWRRLYRGWWISSYFSRDRRPCYEILYNNGDLHSEGIWFADFCLPITTLRQQKSNN